MALPKKNHWDKPITTVLKITINWIKGSLKYSATIGIKAIDLKSMDNKILVSHNRCLKK
jgi:hypothetical protein